MPIYPVDDFVAANGLRLRYQRWLPLEERPEWPPLVLLHGLASASHIWNLVAPLLAERGYSVTALDQRGHGESDKPASGYDYETIIADDADAVELYARVQCPIKLIVVEQQPTTEEQHAFFARRNAGIERLQSVVRMPDTIHDIPLQRPRELAKEIMSNATPQA